MKKRKPNELLFYLTQLGGIPFLKSVFWVASYLIVPVNLDFLM